METLKIAVVGAGLIGKKHIEYILKNADCSLAGIVDPDRLANSQLADSLGVPLYQDIDELLTQRVDGVIISSPNQFHAKQAIKCIDKCVPVLIEKPITDSLDDGVKLVELVKKKSAKVLIGHHRAHSPILTTARKIIQDGCLGRIVTIMGSALFYKPDEYFSAGPWRTKMGGGPILINLIHEIGNFRSLCGEISAVQAISSSAIRNFPVEDTVVINFQFASGALGTFVLSDTAASARSWEHTSQENKSYPVSLDEDCYTVSGTMGSLSIPTMRIKYYKSPDSQSWWIPFENEIIPVDRLDPLECQLNHFLNVIKGTANPLVSAEDGLQNLKITNAIAESAKRKKLTYL